MRKIEHLVTPDDLTTFRFKGKTTHVLSTAALAAWIEDLAMNTIAENSDLDPLGARLILDIRHRRAAVLGATVEITVTCTDADGLRTEWEVLAQDDFGDVLVTGVVLFVEVDPEDYYHRYVLPKLINRSP
jgi:predicted thioesterase